MKARLTIMLFLSLALHGWLLRAAPVSEVKAPSGALALQLGQLRLAAPHAAKTTETVENPVPPVNAELPEAPPVAQSVAAALQQKVPKQKSREQPPIELAEKPPAEAPVHAVSEPQPPKQTASNKAAADEKLSLQATEAASALQNTQQSVSAEPVLVERPTFASPPTAPSYPELARQRRQQGTVVVEVQLDCNGAQRMRTLLQSSGVASLDAAALAAVANWEFLPYRENGRAHLSRVRLPIRFSL